MLNKVMTQSMKRLSSPRNGGCWRDWGSYVRYYREKGCFSWCLSLTGSNHTDQMAVRIRRMISSTNFATSLQKESLSLPLSNMSSGYHDAKKKMNTNNTTPSDRNCAYIHRQYHASTTIMTIRTLSSTVKSPRDEKIPVDSNQQEASDSQDNQDTEKMDTYTKQQDHPSHNRATLSSHDSPPTGSAAPDEEADRTTTTKDDKENDDDDAINITESSPSTTMVTKRKKSKDDNLRLHDIAGTISIKYGIPRRQNAYPIVKSVMEEIRKIIVEEGGKAVRWKRLGVFYVAPRGAHWKTIPIRNKKNDSNNENKEYNNNNEKRQMRISTHNVLRFKITRTLNQEVPQKNEENRNTTITSLPPDPNR